VIAALYVERGGVYDGLPDMAWSARRPCTAHVNR
jgi:hypothetical protein